MNVNYKIRTAHEVDINHIMNIERACFSLDICENQSVFLERIRIFKDGFYVLEFKGSIIGYISTEIWDYEEEVKEKQFRLGHSIKSVHNEKGNELYISSMGILPEFRGSGLGKTLFQEATDSILKKNKNLKSIILIVSDKWYKARDIYKKNDFDEILTIRGFFEYSNYKEDGIVMRKAVINK